MSDGDLRSFHLEVLRSARVTLLGGARPTELWYALHGYRQLARRFLPRFAPVAGPDRLIVAPEGLSRFYLDPEERPHGTDDTIGASWMTREDREAEIRDYVRYLDRTAREVEARGPSPVHRTVLGFSQGAHTASRWAVLGTVRPDRLVLWGAGFPGDLPPQAADRLREVEILLVRGDADQLRNRDEEAREEAWLTEEGLSHRIVRHPGGHRIDAGVLREIAG